ncbi:MAG: iron-containing alcohol dehydrogenase [Proteobacteria bacterium]|nr:iron-containing alcohol dehydrogenase [Pseudomonadota bacterium]
MSWRYHNPVDVRFGPGSLAELPKLVRGRRVAAVVFPEAASVGVTARLAALLGDALAVVIDRTEPNPDVAGLASLYEAFWAGANPPDVIVAVGGGSAIDTAKALMVGTADHRFASLVALLATGKPFTPHAVKPLIAIPTTAGTGSEVTPWATVWDRAAQRKYSLHLPETWPTAAIIDPELTQSLPAGPTLAAALDALSHALESIWNVNANSVSDTHAIAAASTVLEVLPRLMADLRNPELRERMSLAALQAGLAFSNTKTALAHSISYEMTLRHGLPHGIACSFTLPMVLDRARGALPDRDAVLAQIFGADLAGAPARLATFLEGVGVRTDFAAYGVDAATERRMIADALDGVRGKNFIGAARAAAAHP